MYLKDAQASWFESIEQFSNPLFSLFVKADSQWSRSEASAEMRKVNTGSSLDDFEIKYKENKLNTFTIRV